MSGGQGEGQSGGPVAVGATLREALTGLLYDHVDPRSVWGGVPYWRCRGCDAHAGTPEDVDHESGCAVYTLFSAGAGA